MFAALACSSSQGDSKQIETQGLVLPPDNPECIPQGCPAPNAWNQELCQCEPPGWCPSGESWNSSLKTCELRCPSGTSWSSNLGWCIPSCSKGKVWNGSECVCSTGSGGSSTGSGGSGGGEPSWNVGG